MNPDAYSWGLTEQLLAAAVDALHVANWQRSGGKKKDRPKQIPRPGLEDTSTAVFKGDVMSIEDMDAWLGWNATTITAT